MHHQDQEEEDEDFGHSLHDQKICSDTGSFSVPRDVNNQPVSLLTVRLRHKYDIQSVCHGLTDDDGAILTLYTQTPHSLKASTTQQLINWQEEEGSTTIGDPSLQQTVPGIKASGMQLLVKQ